MLPDALCVKRFIEIAISRVHMCVAVLLMMVSEQVSSVEPSSARLRTDRAQDGTESLKQLKRFLTCQSDLMFLELCKLQIAAA